MRIGGFPNCIIYKLHFYNQEAEGPQFVSSLAGQPKKKQTEVLLLLDCKSVIYKFSSKAVVCGNCLVTLSLTLKYYMTHSQCCSSYS